MTNNNTVLSLSPDQDALRKREIALRNNGLKVISVLSPIQARFEIEMGRCGVFLICYRVAPDEASELITLFRRYCPEGRVIFVTRPGQKRDAPTGTNISVPESKGSELVLRALKEVSSVSSSTSAPSE